MKKFNVLELVILLSPIIDVLTSISQREFNIDLSMGLIIRGALLFFMIMFLIVRSNFKYKKISLIYVAALVFYSCIYLLITYLSKGKMFVLAETKGLIKAFYFPTCVVSLFSYIETRKKEVSPKLIFAVMLEYVALLLIPSIFGLGYESYAEDKIGTIGWFFSANEISAIYAILFVFIVFSYDNIKNKLIYIVLVSAGLYTVMQIGTKIPAIAAGASIICFIVVELIQYIINREKDSLSKIGIGILMSLVFVIVFIKSPVAINFDIYRDYLIKTESSVDSTESTVEEVQQESAGEQQATESVAEAAETEEDTATNKEETNLTGEQIATIIHSGRIETKNEIKERFNNSPAIQKLFGIGTMEADGITYNLCEIDYYDIFFNFGFIGFIIYFAPIVWMLIYIIIDLRKKSFPKTLDNNKYCCYSVAIIIGLLLCAIGGHTLVAPSVSIYITIALIQLFRIRKGAY